MDFGIRGKTALVCGGSRGIGFAAARELLGEGVSVHLVGRDQASLDRAVRELSPHGTVRGFTADLATLEGIAAVRARVTDADILITNTGGPPTGVVFSHDWTAWERAIALLLRSATEMCRAYVPGMQARKWGRVIGITSLAVKRPEPALVLSNSLRAAVTGYFRTLADEVAADGVTVNTVLPGYTETERLVALAEANATRTGTTPDAIYDGWRAAIPVRRLGRPEELGATIAFLASQQAGYITGQPVLVDGGAIRSLM